MSVSLSHIVLMMETDLGTWCLDDANADLFYYAYMLTARREGG